MRATRSSIPAVMHSLLAAAVLWLHVLVVGNASFLGLPNHTANTAVISEILGANQSLLWLLVKPVLGIALLYGLFFCLIVVLSQARSPREQALRARIGVLLLTWAASLWLLFDLHLRWFPRSIWAWWTEPLFLPKTSALISLAAALWLGWRILGAAGCYGSAVLQQVPAMRRRPLGLLLLIIVVSTAGWSMYSTPPKAASALSSRPHIVIIGLDSVRRDIALGDRAAEIPHLTAFRQRAFVEANVVSPVARTFPAWVTILTGHDPKQSGARDNLVAQQQIKRDGSFAWKLKALGYRTVYATDETRFSNIGAAFGFDRVLSPQPGAADFLISEFADLPLVNFAVQLPHAELLFPSLVGNRAFAQAYRPRRFVDRLIKNLGPAGDRPTAIAIHLCMAHWPYFSAQSQNFASAAQNAPYFRAVTEVDQQFGYLQSELRRLGYLDERSLMIVLSDHGESISLAESAPASVGGDLPGSTVATPGTGHGASVLAPPQWQVFMMFAGATAYGRIPPGRSEKLASLADLSDSLMDLIGEPVGEDLYRLGVVDAIPGRAPSTAAGQRKYVELETGFSPKGLNLTQPDKKKALQLATSSFDVLADGTVAMKTQVYREALKTKDFGVTDGRRVLGLVQTAADTVLVEVDEHGRWTLFPSTKPQKSSASPVLLEWACRHSEMKSRLESWCAPG